MRASAASSFLVACAILAGCTDATQADLRSSDAIGPQAAAFDETTGAIAGVVTDDQLRPLPLAALVLDGSESVVADEAGAFAFNYVQPGEHVVAAAVDGHAAAETKVLVEAGRETKTTFALIPLRSVGAYHETLIQAGTDTCSAAYRLPVLGSEGGNTIFNYSVSCYIDIVTAGGSQSILEYGPLDLEGVVGFWFETTWRSTQSLGTQMKVGWSYPEISAAGASSNWIFLDLVGDNPVAAPFSLGNLTASLQEHSSPTCTTENCTIEVFHWSAPNDFGVLPMGLSVGAGASQRFEDYVTIFHGGDMPAAVSALPDS